MLYGRAIWVIVARRKVILYDCAPRVGELLPDELSRYGMATEISIPTLGRASFSSRKMGLATFSVAKLTHLGISMNNHLLGQNQL